jgi:hypothetical protein
MILEQPSAPWRVGLTIRSYDGATLRGLHGIALPLPPNLPPGVTPAPELWLLMGLKKMQATLAASPLPACGTSFSPAGAGQTVFILEGGRNGRTSRSEITFRDEDGIPTRFVMHNDGVEVERAEVLRLEFQ